MKISKEQAARNRELVIEAAARLFRERGIDGVAVADVMEAAGFTHGGFYNHFPTKEALAVEACYAAFGEAIATLTAAVEAGEPRAGLLRYAEQYLSPSHRDDRSSGCPTGSLAADASRQPEEVQAAYAAGLESTLAVFAAALGDDRRAALRLMSELVGALTLARAVAAARPKLSSEILKASREALA